MGSSYGNCRVIFLGLFLFSVADAATLEGTPHNYRRLLSSLSAGDTLELQPGTYRAGLSVHRMVGEQGRPIVITGVEGESRPVFVARAGRNTVSIVDSGYVQLKNLELDGQGLAVDGVKAEGHSRWTHHIVLENLLIRGHGNNQQTVGISTKCLAWGWVIRRNVIIGAGTGIYLGNSDGRKPFIAGLIEHNLIIDSIGYNLQIKHQLAQPEIPGQVMGQIPGKPSTPLPQGEKGVDAVLLSGWRSGSTSHPATKGPLSPRETTPWMEEVGRRRTLKPRDRVRGSIGHTPTLDVATPHRPIASTHGVVSQRERGYFARTSDGKKTIIRHNLFSKADGGSTEDMARPNVLVGHWPRSGPGANDAYLIYGNLFYANPHEALFQGEGNIGLYDNLFVNPHGDAIHIQPHNDVPRRVDIFNNTVVAAGAGITIRRKEGDDRFSQLVVGNAIFASPALAGGERYANLSRGFGAAGDYLTSPYVEIGRLSLFPKAGRLENNSLDLARFDRYLDWNRDFNGVVRSGRYLGAYSGEGVNPGWRLQLGRKP